MRTATRGVRPVTGTNCDMFDDFPPKIFCYFQAGTRRTLLRRGPTAKLVMIADCKTLVCWDQPQRLAQLISDFAEA